MAQQINLHTPVLLQQRRQFSALAMAASLGVFAAGLAALALGLSFATREARAELEATTQAGQAERAQLSAALAAQPVQTPEALQQERLALQAELKRRRELLQELRTGLLSDGRGNAALLRLLAQSVPGVAWLTEVRLADGRVEVSGETLDPAVLEPWIARLGADPLLAGRPLAALRVEQRVGDAALAERWGFTLVNGTPAPRQSGAPAPGAAR